MTSEMYNRKLLYLSRHLVLLVAILELRIIRQASSVPPSEVVIGVLYSVDSTGLMDSLYLAVDYVNERDDLLPNTSIRILPARVSSSVATFQYIQQACYLLGEGVHVIIGPETSAAVKSTAAIMEALHVPQISQFATDTTLSISTIEYPYLLKLSSPNKYQVEALAELAKKHMWSRFAIVASLGDYGRNGAQNFQVEATKYDWLISHVLYFYPEPDPEDIDISDELQDIRDKGARIVLMWCMADQAAVILRQADRLGMTTNGWAWLVTDGTTVFSHNLYDGCNPVPTHLIGLLGTCPTYNRGGLYDTFQQLWQDRYGPLNTSNELQALIEKSFDSVLVAAHGIHAYIEAGHSLTTPTFTTSLCSGRTDHTPWQQGSTLMQYLSQVNVPGVTSQLNFTAYRHPEPAEYTIVNLQDEGFLQVGAWSQHTGLSMGNTSIVYMGHHLAPPYDTSTNLRDVTLRVVTIIEAPYVMYTTESERKAEPGVLLKGLCIALLEQLRRDLEFEYTLHVVQDGKYGSLVREEGREQRWNGIVGELISNVADIAVASLTITFEREHVIDFTTPYQDLGLTFLIAKDSPNNQFWHFLTPFQWDLWGAVVGAFIVCALATSACSFVSPYGHRGRYIQRRDVDDHSKRSARNNLRIADGLWFSFASWMQQGQDLSPLCFSGRLVHGFWWFAVMVITATYTANLAAFLTVARLEQGITTISDLANQNDIRYGTMKDSAVEDFFSTSSINPYWQMNSHMEEYNTAFDNTSQALQMVLDSHGKPPNQQYAYIFDSAPLEYAANQEPCTLRVGPNLFNNFGYGIALRKNSPYLDAFNIMILRYREDGFMEELYANWFQGTCSSDDSANMIGEQATLESMAGVFYFLAIGVGGGILTILCECCVAASKDRSHFKQTKDGPQSFCGCLQRRIQLVMSDLVRSFCRQGDDMGQDISTEGIEVNQYVVTRPDSKPVTSRHVTSISNGHVIDNNGMELLDANGMHRISLPDFFVFCQNHHGPVVDEIKQPSVS